MELSVVDFRIRLVQYPDDGTFGVQILFAPLGSEAEARDQLQWVRDRIEQDLGWTLERCERCEPRH